MKVGVVGAGLMGTEIALIFALAGHEVTLTDREPATLKQAMDRLQQLMEKGANRGFYKIDDVQPTLHRIKPDADIRKLAHSEIVTEAVFESLGVKSRVLKDLIEIVEPNCIIASNTSTIPISTLAAELPKHRRSNFLGTHYFSPVSRMKLVEVIPGFDSDATVVDQVIKLMDQIGKVGIRIKDVAGFAVNRMLHMLIIEAVKLVEEGVATPEDLDTACRLGLGHPIGPFALMDAVTSSLCVQGQNIMQEAYGDRFRPPPLLVQRARAGYVGGKDHAGWLGASRK